MDPSSLRPLPSFFILQDLTAITARACEFKINPNEAQATENLKGWFSSFGPYRNERERILVLKQRFEYFGARAFPIGDVSHLETCIIFFLWAFSFDDVSDEGELQCEPERVKIGVDLCSQVLDQPLGTPPPKYKYAVMLHDLWHRYCATATPSACERFALALKIWMYSQIEQAANRSQSTVPSVQDFIELRRRTIGGMTVEAMVVYSIDADIPNHVWYHPTMIEISKAVIDIMTWPNDLCSFNKEQADGDYQNLVACVMLEHDLDLQSAVNVVTSMLAKRVDDYMEYKKLLPSFGEATDRELARYFKALEHYVQGTVHWYYHSTRYFRDIDISNKRNLVVPVFRSTTETKPKLLTIPQAPRATPKLTPIVESSLHSFPILLILLYTSLVSLLVVFIVNGYNPQGSRFLRMPNVDRSVHF
ncbi:isoprenoid synthase domain-containing protein [Abortiporus biennis]|nr:isoprenoid synthase domain-containing protein [Abortiporus biennis]